MRAREMRRACGLPEREAHHQQGGGASGNVRVQREVREIGRAGRGRGGGGRSRQGRGKRRRGDPKPASRYHRKRSSIVVRLHTKKKVVG